MQLRLLFIDGLGLHAPLNQHIEKHYSRARRRYRKIVSPKVLDVTSHGLEHGSPDFLDRRAGRDAPNKVRSIGAESAHGSLDYHSEAQAAARSTAIS